MNDREYEKTKRRVERYFRLWTTALGLGFWHIRVTYERESKPEMAKGLCCLGEAVCNWKYLQCDLTFYMPDLLSKKDNEIEEVVVHELTHALVNEMREPDDDVKHEERVVSTISRALIWTKDWKSSTRQLVRLR